MDSITLCCPNPALPLKLQVVLQPFLEPSLIPSLNGSPPLRLPNSEPLTPVQGTPEDLCTGLGLFCSEALAHMLVSVCQDLSKHPAIPTFSLYQRGLGCATHSLTCRVRLSAGTLPRRGQGKVQGTMSSLGPGRASCHSAADRAQERGTPGQGQQG